MSSVTEGYETAVDYDIAHATPADWTVGSAAQLTFTSTTLGVAGTQWTTESSLAAICST